MSRVVLMFAFIFSAMATMVAHADEIAVYGAGNTQCRTWIYARENPNADQTLKQFAGMWLLGYASAINEYETHIKASAPWNPEMIFGWVDRYCRAFPEDQMKDAIQTMIVQSRPKH